MPELLDNNEEENDKVETLPSIVLLEVKLFPILNILTYLLILSMFGIIFALLLHFVIGIWQFLSCLACWQIQHNPWRNLYKKLLLWLIGLGVAGALIWNYQMGNEGVVWEIWDIFWGLWLFVFPHCLNWLYWVAVRHDANRINGKG